MPRLFKKTILTLGLALSISLLAGCNGARSVAWEARDKSSTGFLIKSLKFENSDQTYALFVPHSYSPTKKYPVIVFLHGVGEGGNDAKGPLHVGLAPFVFDQQSTFPFIVIFPQSGGGSWKEDSSSAREVIAVFEQVKKDYSVDDGCVTLTGLSTGGYGTWAIGATYKQYFSALVPMGSSANPEKFAPQLTDMPIRSYHNFGDPFAGEWNDSNMAEKVNALGGKVQYTRTNGGGHDCWSGVYGGTELFDWMRSQRKRAIAASPSAPAKSVSAAPVAPAVAPLKTVVAPAAASVKPAAVPAKSRSDDQALVPTVY